MRLDADYLWDPVATQIRATLLDAFGFDRRALGQPALLSRNHRAIQSTTVSTMWTWTRSAAFRRRRQHGRHATLLTLDQITAAVQQIVDPRQADPAQEYRPRRIVPAARGCANSADLKTGHLRPAQLAIFTDAVPDTLILNQIL